MSLSSSICPLCLWKWPPFCWRALMQQFGNFFLEAFHFCKKEPRDTWCEGWMIGYAGCLPQGGESWGAGWLRGYTKPQDLWVHWPSPPGVSSAVLAAACLLGELKTVRSSTCCLHGILQTPWCILQKLFSTPPLHWPSPTCPMAGLPCAPSGRNCGGSGEGERPLQSLFSWRSQVIPLWKCY
jgi:hypothetical protein